MRVLAVISKREVVDKILAHVRLPVDPETLHDGCTLAFEMTDEPVPPGSWEPTRIQSLARQDRRPSSMGPTRRVLSRRRGWVARVDVSEPRGLGGWDCPRLRNAGRRFVCSTPMHLP